MNLVFATINAFIEDTCVLSVIAYLLTRISSLGDARGSRLVVTNRWKFGLVLGLVGLTETVFPGARFPYVTNTLIGTYAAFIGGVEVGAIALGVMTVGSLVWQPIAGVFGPALAVVLSMLVGLAIRRAAQGRFQIIAGLVAGMLAQAIISLVYIFIPELVHTHFSVQHALVNIPANGFGVILLLLIVHQVEHEAQVRAESERNRLEAEHSRALLAEAQIVALRARVHPHFLYNTLTSIASLCRIDPDRAETAIVRLGEIMRRALEGNTQKAVPLHEELESVKGYVWIEQQRLGARLQIEWDVHPACNDILVPSFSMQTLVENAIIHGVAPQPEAGSYSDLSAIPSRTTYSSPSRITASGWRRVSVKASWRRPQTQIHGLQITQSATDLFVRREVATQSFQSIAERNTRRFCHSAITDATRVTSSERC